MGFRIKGLTSQEIFVLENRPEKSYKDIGRLLGVSSSRAQQIGAKAGRKCRILKIERPIKISQG